MQRARLTERIFASGHAVCCIEAGPGWEVGALLTAVSSAADSESRKLAAPPPESPADRDQLLSELAAADERFGNIATGTQLGGRLRECNVMLLLDDAHRWDRCVTDLLSEMANIENSQPLVVLVSRSVPSALRASIVVTAQHLAYTHNEIAELGAARGVGSAFAPHLLTITGGWPKAVSSCVDLLVGAPKQQAVLQDLIRSPRVVDRLISSALDGVASDDLALAETMALLPRFDADIAALLGDDQLLDRLRRAGLPITEEPSGWMTIAAPFGHRLAAAGTVPEALPIGLTQHFVYSGDVEGALRTALAFGSHIEAARVLSSIEVEDALTVELGYLNSVLTTIGDAAFAHPRCLQIVAQTNGIASNMPQGMAALERAAAHFATADPGLEDPHHVELLTELGIWQFFGGNQDAAVHAAQRCEAVIGDDPILRARLLDLKGLLSTGGNTVAGLEEARGHLAEALAVWRSLGRTRAAVVTGFRLAISVLPSLGRRNEALELLESLNDVGAISMLDQARIGLYSATMMPAVGRAADVAERLANARRLGPVLELDWITGWADWTEAVAASVLGQTGRVVELADGLESSRVTIVSPGTTALMWTEIAEALARVQHPVAAERAMRHAREFQLLPDWCVDYAECSLLARHGDPARAIERLEAYGERPDAEPEKRWSAELLLALAHHRLGNATSAKTHLDNARQEARAIHQPGIHEQMEATIVERLKVRPVAAEPVGGVGAETTISVFGAFSVEVAGRPVQLSGGQVTAMVKMLVVHDGHMVVDQLIDALWPDAKFDVGRRRLRNVVLRVRQTCGDILDRSGEVLSLNDRASSDWQEAGRLALAAVPGADLDLLKRACAAWRDPLLPQDLYAPWADAARAEQRRHRTRLLRLVANRQEELGDHTAAIETLLELDHVDGDNGTQADRVARLRSLQVNKAP